MIKTWPPPYLSGTSDVVFWKGHGPSAKGWENLDKYQSGTHTLERLGITRLSCTFGHSGKCESTRTKMEVLSDESPGPQRRHMTLCKYDTICFLHKIMFKTEVLSCPLSR